MCTRRQGDLTADQVALEAVPASAPAASTHEIKPLPAKGTARENPAEVTFLSRRKLNGAGSEKETWHLEFDLSRDGLSYTAGDSFGVFRRE